jgi:hypothetical protein
MVKCFFLVSLPLALGSFPYSLLNLILNLILFSFSLALGSLTLALFLVSLNKKCLKEAIYEFSGTCLIPKFERTGILKN